jgi:glycosyltransferase involved in cell wall biosynthesis
MKLLALMKYGDKAASTRQRLLQYRENLAQYGIEIEFSPLLTNDYLARRFRGTAVSARSILSRYVSRLRRLLEMRNFDLIWVHCEVFPYIIGAAERIVFASGKPVIYDYDDAIFHQYDTHANPFVRFLLGRKLEPLLRGSALCVCGNAYLKQYAARFCPRTEIVPTVVDATRYVPRRHARSGQRITIGWIGSPSTWPHVKPYVPLLSQLAAELDLSIRVIGAEPTGLADPRFEFLSWSEEAEIEAIQGMDIGIMPVPDKPWERGKCGYKLIQYMACGLPVIASPVGVNAQIVEHGVNGILARDEEEWEDAIRQLAASKELRVSMGHAGRERAVKEYSLQVYGPRLSQLLAEIAYGNRKRGGFACAGPPGTEKSVPYQ